VDEIAPLLKYIDLLIAQVGRCDSSGPEIGLEIGTASVGFRLAALSSCTNAVGAILANGLLARLNWRLEN
jgi:hypothetical protein